MTAIDVLIQVARAYGDAEQIELSTVSWRALGDTKKLGALVDGRDIQVRRCEAAMRWFSENWPENAQWPVGIVRPKLHDGTVPGAGQLVTETQPGVVS